MRIKRTYTTKPQPSNNHEDFRKKVWLNAWCSVASAITCNTTEIATKWADRALEDFDERFK